MSTLFKTQLIVENRSDEGILLIRFSKEYRKIFNFCTDIQLKRMNPVSFYEEEKVDSRFLYEALNRIRNEEFKELPDSLIKEAIANSLKHFSAWKRNRKFWNPSSKVNRFPNHLKKDRNFSFKLSGEIKNFKDGLYFSKIGKIQTVNKIPCGIYKNAKIYQVGNKWFCSLEKLN